MKKKSLQEFENELTEYVTKEIEYPLVLDILTRQLIKTTIAVGIPLKEILYQIHDCYDFYKNILDNCECENEES